MGKDRFGNRYYRQRKNAKNWHKERRWVLYKGMAQASKVPPPWYGWLHHTYQHPPQGPCLSYTWEKPHLPNLTGTPYAYHPQGYFLRNGTKIPVSKGYESWAPENGALKKNNLTSL